MTDTNDDDAGSPRSRSGPRRPSGERPFRSRDDRPPRSGPRSDDRPPRPARPEGGSRFQKPRDGDRPYRARSDEGPRPPRARSEGGPRTPRFRDDRPPPRRAPGGDERPRRAAREDAPAPAPSEPAEERIAKAIARAGIASRRDAEAMIAEGRVTLNGKVLDSPAVNVTPADAITVDGEHLPARERTRLWIFHKPRGLVTTARDPEGRPTVFENLPDDLPRVVAIGRLDMNTEGLLLLTNDGGLAKVIAHPETGWLRRYRVRAHGDVTQADLDKLRGGVTVDEMDYGPIEATLDRVQGDNVWITMGLREGKNREVKRILEHLGLRVNRLIRLSFGPFQLGDLEPGLVEEVRTRVLKDQLGQKLAEEAGVDFESPVREPIAPFGPPPRASHRDEERPRQHADRPESGRFGRDRNGERAFRPRDDDRGARPSREKSAPGRERHGTVWRAEDASEHRGGRAPRRGADAKAARSAAGERPRERVGAIAAGERKVLVERLVSAPRPVEDRPERPARPPRFADDDRPRRRDDGNGDRPARPPRPDGDRAGRDGPPRRPRSAAPPRARDDGRPGREFSERSLRGRGGFDDRPKAGGFGRNQGGPRAGGPPTRSGRPPARPGGPGARPGGPRPGGKGPRGRKP